MYKKGKNIIFYFLIISILLSLTMHISLFMDESFTISLIRYSFIRLISIDTMDIHPPFYYIFLKAILLLTTFWSDNIITKIVAARIISLILLLLTILISFKIMNIISSKYNKQLFTIIILIVSLQCQQVTNIRMYPLMALLISLQFFSIIKYGMTKNAKYIILATAFAILSAYTHNFSALIAGLLLLVIFLINLMNKNYNISFKWLLSGFCFFIAYIPWIKISITQISNMPKHYWISYMGTLKDLIKFIIVIFIFLYPILVKKNLINTDQEKLLKYILSVCLLTLFITFIVSIFKPIFMLRYIYPLIFIYISVTYGILSDINKQSPLLNIKVLNVNYLIIILCLFLVIGAKTIYSSTKSQLSYHKQSTYLMESHIYKKRTHIYINTSKISKNYNNVGYLCQFNTYAQYNNDYLTRKENKTITTNSDLKSGTNTHLMNIIWDTKN